MQRLIALYKRWSGEEPLHTEKLPGAGSNRAYYRITDKDGHTVVGVVGTSRDEDHAFLYLADHFAKRKLPVPRVLAVDDDELRYIQEDLGSVSLFDVIRGGREAENGSAGPEDGGKQHQGGQQRGVSLGRIRKGSCHADRGNGIQRH